MNNSTLSEFKFIDYDWVLLGTQSVPFFVSFFILIFLIIFRKLKAIKFRGSVPFLAAFCIWIFILRILIAKFSFLRAENDRSLIHG